MLDFFAALLLLAVLAVGRIDVAAKGSALGHSDPASTTLNEPGNHPGPIISAQLIARNP